MGNIKGEFPFTMNNAQDIRFCNKSWFKVEQSGNLLNLKALSPVMASSHPRSIKDNSSGPGEGEKWEKSGGKCLDSLLSWGFLYILRNV